MKTIQEYLKVCNRKEIIESYIYKYVFTQDLMNKKNKKITIGEVIEKYEDILNKYIDKLISINVKLDDSETWILLTTHAANIFNDDDLAHLLISKNELFYTKKLEDIDTYGYEFSDFEEILGYYVADTYLTQYYLTDLIVTFLYESSWTGFNHEDLEKEKKNFEDAIKEIDIQEGNFENYKSIDEFYKELEENFDFEFEKKDARQEKEYNKYLQHCAHYNKTCRKIELEKLKKLIENK